MEDESVLLALQRGSWTVSAWRCVWSLPVRCWGSTTFIWPCPRTMSGSCSAPKTLATQPRSPGTVQYVTCALCGSHVVSCLNVGFKSSLNLNLNLNFGFHSGNRCGPTAEVCRL